LLQDVIFSFPVTCSGGKWSIKQGLKLDDFSKGKLEATGKELVEEKALALECLNQK
jgi:malate dehydrogenase